MPILTTLASFVLPAFAHAHDGVVHVEESLMLGLTTHELQMGVFGLGLLTAGIVVLIKRR